MRKTTCRSSRPSMLLLAGAALAPALLSAQSGTPLGAGPSAAASAVQRTSGLRATVPHSEVRVGEYVAAPWVAEAGGPRGAGRVVGSSAVLTTQDAETVRRLQLQELVYVRPPAGRALAAGDRLVTYDLGPVLARLGQVVLPTGVLVVERVQPGQAVEARIVEQFASMDLGQGVLPYDAPEFPTGVRPQPVASGGLMTKVAWVEGDPVLPTLQFFVVLEAGARAGLRPGDQVTFLRERQRTAEGDVLPESEIAVARVIRVTPQATTAMIIGQVQPAIAEGTAARLTARMP